MTLTSLQALTWVTVTGAVVSALLLAAVESGMADFGQLRRATAAISQPLPHDPPGAVPPLHRPASAAADTSLTRPASGTR